MLDFVAFGKDGQSWSVGAGEGLTIENGLDSIALYGEARFEPGSKGSERAKELLGVLEAISGSLTGDKLAQGGSSLWAQTRSGVLTLGGDVQVSKSDSRQSLAKAVAGLRKFVAANPIGEMPVGGAAKSSSTTPSGSR